MAKDRVKTIVQLWKDLESHWRRAKDTQTKYYNEHYTPIEYSVGEMVLLSSQHIKTAQPSKKLGHRRLGPFKIIERIGKQAYRLKLSPRYKSIHNVFYVSLLEPYRRRPGEELKEIGPEMVDGEEEWEVEKILAHKAVQRGNTVKHEYLVRWLGFTSADDQWVPEEDFGDPNFIEEYHWEYPRELPASYRRWKRKRKRASDS
jgi:hypothetical protein